MNWVLVWCAHRFWIVCFLQLFRNSMHYLWPMECLIAKQRILNVTFIIQIHKTHDSVCKYSKLWFCLLLRIKVSNNVFTFSFGQLLLVSAATKWGAMLTKLNNKYYLNTILIRRHSSSIIRFSEFNSKIHCFSIFHRCFSVLLLSCTHSNYRKYIFINMKRFKMFIGFYIALFCVAVL